MGASWRVERVAGVVLARCQALASIDGIAHAFSTRVPVDGASFDLARSEDPRFEARRRRFLSAAGFGGLPPTDLRQVHGDRVLAAAECAAGELADGAIWTSSDTAPAIPSIRFADCVPILLAARSGDAAAAVHAGWRGTAAGIAARAVEGLGSRGIEPRDLVAALGPAILSCCYEVGPEVAEAIDSASGAPLVHRAGPRRVDLHDANRRQLLRAGVPDGAIHAAPWCTRCRADLFFSHRREGEASGRMMASVGPARREP